MLFKDEKGHKVNFAGKNDDNGSTKSVSFLDRLQEQTDGAPDPSNSEESAPSDSVILPVAAPPQLEMPSWSSKLTSDEPHEVQPKSPLQSVAHPIQSVFSPAKQSSPPGPPPLQPPPRSRATTPTQMATPQSDLTDLEGDENRPAPSKVKSKPVRAQKKGKKKAGIVLDSNDKATLSSRPPRIRRRRTITRKGGSNYWCASLICVLFAPWWLAFW